MFDGRFTDGDGDIKPYFTYPQVKEEDWCGEFKEKVVASKSELPTDEDPGETYGRYR